MEAAEEVFRKKALMAPGCRKLQISQYQQRLAALLLNQRQFVEAIFSIAFHTMIGQIQSIMSLEISLNERIDRMLTTL